MSIVNNYFFKNCRLRLSNANYYDLVLSSDCNGFDNSTLYCDEINSGSTLLVYFDFNNPLSYSGKTIHSLTTWDDSILPSSGLTLCDIGLTGVDVGLVSNLSGETLYIDSGDSRFYMTQVSGTSHIYPMEYSGDCSGNYMKFCGGFYQGFYKLDDFDYQVLPTRFSDGWTSEFWLKKEDCYLTGVTGTTLNETYPNNKGFFQVMGIRSENKFWDFFSGETGLTTCLNTAHTLTPEVSYSDPMSGMNPFLYYSLIAGENPNGMFICSCGCGCESSCTGSTSHEVQVLYKNKDYLSDIVDNIIGFRIKDDGSIGYRLISMSGECSGSTVSGYTTVTGYTVEEGYSISGVVKDNEWTHIAIRYNSDWVISEDKLDCPCSGNNKQYCPRTGSLSFYVNGYLKYRVTPFIEIIPRRLDDFSEKQIGVPYTMSIGGGTQGLIETRTFNGPDINDENLPIQDNFAGTFIGGISKFRFYSTPLDVTEIRCNYNYDYNSIFKICG